MLSICATLSVQYFNAQITPIGSQDYGRIFDVTYDAKIQNRVYAITLNNTIIISNDNGTTWQPFFSMPYTEGGNIKDLKLINHGKSLSFISQRGHHLESIKIFDLSTKSIIKSFALPNEYDNPWVTSYDFNEDNPNELVIDTNWPVGLGAEGKSFVTYNNGSSWKEIYYTEDNKSIFIEKVAFNPNNSNQLYLARGNGKQGELGGFWTSKDKGDTWEKSLEDIAIGTFAFNPSNANEIFAGTGITFNQRPEGLHHSTDNGKTWQKVAITWGQGGILNNINRIDFNPKDPKHIVILEEDEVLTSFDGGATWTQKQYPYDNTDSYYYGLATSFNPFKPQEVMVSSNYKPLFSNNGGQSFNKQVLTPYYSSESAIAQVEQNGEKHLYYGVQSGWVHKNLNNQTEEAYEILPLNMVTMNSNRLHFDKNIPGRVYNFNKSFMGSSFKVSNEHGADANTIYTTFSLDLMLATTAPDKPNKIWASMIGGNDMGESIGFLKTFDITDINNAIVEDIELPTTEIITKIIFPTSYEIIIVGGNEIYKSNNNGNTWSKLNDTLIDAYIFDIAQNPTNTLELAIATSSGIFISKDSGKTWTQKTEDIVKKIMFSTANSKNLVAFNFNDQYTYYGIYYSSNSGEEWKKVDNKAIEYISSAGSDVIFQADKATILIPSWGLGLVSYDLNFDNLSTNEPALVRNKISIYPNPASDFININTDKKINKISIYDATGRLVKTSSEIKTSVSELKSGVYFVTADLADHSVINTKFIKN